MSPPDFGCNAFSEQDRSIGETGDTLVTSSEVLQTAKRSIVQADKSLIIFAADLHISASLQLVQLGIELRQREVAAHDSPSIQCQNGNHKVKELPSEGDQQYPNDKYLAVP